VSAEEFELVGTQAVQFEYPSALLQSLPAALWENSRKLTKLYEDAYMRTAHRRGSGG